MTALLVRQAFIEPSWRITMAAPTATVQSADALVIHGKPWVFVASSECRAIAEQNIGSTGWRLWALADAKLCPSVHDLAKGWVSEP